MKARYVRISTPNQNKERQLVNNYPNEKLYIDVCSGAIPFNKREQGVQLLKSVEFAEIENISVHAVDRLGRNLLDILTTLKYLDDHKVSVKIDSLGLESRIKNKPNPAFKLITTVMGQIGEMERETMLERQKEGIAIAKAKGVYKGRVRGSKQSDKEFLSNYTSVIKELNAGMSLRKTSKLCDVSLGTVQKVKRIFSA
ncbi:recombinase family protein [Winogradskyella thalassocola]|uniref:Site-specific DNA recombinase n=1 Tax=Winogradskyella thalassocola TaxID=262004 RepID=A0A1G7WH73_9FLAO|nr:recombinase family protein [Winogradskyella thalassocola]SDG71204.1 Site-specific DNA recombinase [Winogradskyella thalassocola]